ncbi:MAG: RimK family alpha-L-glutamate ligase [Clostridia bacterium]|nr:RimK family alpha-L-glutamate ligase [Clostridia bacterium]
MKGCLIVNGFVKWSKFDELYKMLIGAFERKGVELEKIGTLDLIDSIDGGAEGTKLTQLTKEYDFVLFWDKDDVLCGRLERLGLRVFNSSRAIRLCDDKGLTAFDLQNSGIKMPKTFVSPYTFRPFSEYDFLDEVIDELGLPLVVKRACGSFGAQVHLVQSKDELIEKAKLYTPDRMVFQECITSSFGRDVRIHVVGGEVVAAVLRVAKEGEFCANVTNGGKMLPFEPTEEMKELAIRACEALGVDFAGVDVLFGEQPILCEVNTNAHFVNLYNATGVNVADFIADYVIKSV